MNKELQKLINEHMPKRYYGHEARRNAKVIAELYAQTYEKTKMIDFHVEVMKQGLIEEGYNKWRDAYEPSIRNIAEKVFNSLQ